MQVPGVHAAKKYRIEEGDEGERALSIRLGGL